MKKTLYRSRTKKVIAGVCGGLADYFGLDVALIRLVFIILALFDGTGFLLYFLMMIVIPKQPKTQSESGGGYVIYGPDAVDSKGFAHITTQKKVKNDETEHTCDSFEGTEFTDSGAICSDDERQTETHVRTYWIGLTLVALGMYFFILPFLPALKFEYLFALALIGLGVYLTVKK